MPYVILIKKSHTMSEWMAKGMTDWSCRQHLAFFFPFACDYYVYCSLGTIFVIPFIWLAILDFWQTQRIAFLDSMYIWWIQDALGMCRPKKEMHLLYLIKYTIIIKNKKIFDNIFFYLYLIFWVNPGIHVRTVVTNLTLIRCASRDKRADLEF